MSVIDKEPLFRLREEIFVSASPDQVHSHVGDLTRSARWSPKCRGGEWVSGEPAKVGSVFRGKNLRSENVVFRVPLVRGLRHTEARVVAAEPGRTFRWMMLSHTGGDQESVWGFDMEPAEGGGPLVHHYRMGGATIGIHEIVPDSDEAERERFIRDRTAKPEQGPGGTPKRAKDVTETW